MMSENRRWEARVDAQIKVHVVRGRRTVPLETSDVSFKGLFLRTDEPPPVRSLLRLRVSLPQREIEAHAMTVHVAGAGVGVQFWGLAGPDRIAWDDFVRELLLLQRAAAKKKAPAPPTSESVAVKEKTDGAADSEAKPTSTSSGVRRAATGSSHPPPSPNRRSK